MSVTHVALMRGINLSGKNTLPMKSLVEIFVDAGCLEIATYIQSGNVVFDANARDVDELAADVSAEVKRRFGFTVPVVMRSAAGLAGVPAHNPFAGRGESSALAMLFLARVPTRERVTTLDPDRSPGDEFLIVGRDVYLWLPNGFARSKLTNAYFDAKLDTVSTARNWRTVLKLIDMFSKHSGPLSDSQN